MSNNTNQTSADALPQTPETVATQLGQLDAAISTSAQGLARPPAPPPPPVASGLPPPPIALISPLPSPTPAIPPPAANGTPTVPLVAFPLVANVPNSKQHAKQMSKQHQLIVEIRTLYWPDVKAEDLWLLHDGKRGGFAQVPRTLSIMMTIINDIIKRKEGKAMPAGKTYLVLWLHVFGEAIVRIDSEEDAAFEAGYGGERNVSTFRTHMKMLKELGFIDFREGPKGPMQYVLMLNPYKVMKKLQADGLVPLKQFVALLERASVIGSGKELKE
jgi:hypothetical protein